MVTAVYGLGIVMALLVGGAIGLLLAMAHYQRAAARWRRYEQEIADEAGRYAAMRASLQRYAPPRPRDSNATAP